MIQKGTFRSQQDSLLAQNGTVMLQLGTLRIKQWNGIKGHSDDKIGHNDITIESNVDLKMY